MTLILLVIAVVAVLFVARSINVPLNTMIKTVQDVENESDLSKRVGLSHVLELNQLANAFNSMLIKFQSIIADASQVSVTTTNAAEKMVAISEQGSSHLQEQQEQVSSVSRSMDEMTEAVGHVTETITEAVNIAESAHQSAKQGHTVVQQSIEKINQVSVMLNRWQN
ncbi:HAMP domain-containing protein [sulfur-oxidizing endosymbiont of Gigantopelta aegis]|uniref:HAMP domain-containing protein n=1 Tax=sulfur-oxidizing endosymbiont of Gigantopelta aegis TaxID=2794934 RepID=UPI001BE42BE9|nr:methyl-accepting chemotaxis protein [sulfur-oxidizing endosymbiont of Gigantopelta aegis]